VGAGARSLTSRGYIRFVRATFPGTLALVLALGSGLLALGCGEESAAGGSGPNVLVVMTDDQAWGSESQMPFLESEPGFFEFSQAFNNNPLCCPARATFLTGLYSHHTGIEGNAGRDFDPSATLATAFDDAGYETGLFGKYLNGYPWNLGEEHVPEGWDRWVAFTGNSTAAYYDYKLAVDGGIEKYGSEPEDYSTDVLNGYLGDFLDETDGPFFALFAPHGPHPKYVAAPRHEDEFDDEPVELPRNFNRVDGSSYYAGQDPVGKAEARSVVRSQLESLQSEDEAIADAFALLEDRGMLDNTIVVFMTDNGYSVGSHRWIGKRCLYDECAHIPLMFRGPGVTEGETDALVSNADIAPTIAELAGIELAEPDGESLVPIIEGSRRDLGRPVLLRSKRDSVKDPPTAWGLRTERWKYIAYVNGEVDLYDLRSDPGELHDLAGQASAGRAESSLARRMEALIDSE